MIEVLANADGYCIALRVAAETDLSSHFKATCIDTGDTLWVSGWLFSFKPLSDD